MLISLNHKLIEIIQMRTETLSAKKSNGEPNFVKITNAVLKENEKVELLVPAEKFVFTQYESIQEYVQAAGSDDQALSFLNRACAGAAVDAGKLKIRTGTTGDEKSGYSDLIQSGLTATSEWTPAKVERVTAAEAKEQLNALKSEIDNLTPDELYERMRKMFGK